MDKNLEIELMTNRLILLFWRLIDTQNLNTIKDAKLIQFLHLSDSLMQDFNTKVVLFF